MISQTKLRNALQDYLVAQGRMRDKWAEGDDNVKRDLWRNLHACEDAAREALDAPQSDTEEAVEKIGGYLDLTNQELLIWTSAAGFAAAVIPARVAGPVPLVRQKGTLTDLVLALRAALGGDEG